MEEITVQELEENFDDIMDRVSDGEHFLIRTDNDRDLVLMPYDDYTDYYDKFFDHDDGC